MSSRLFCASLSRTLAKTRRSNLHTRVATALNIQPCNKVQHTKAETGQCTSRPDFGTGSFRRFYSTDNELSEGEYESIADETLDSLTEMFEDIPERLDCDLDYDVTFSSGVLTVKISNTWGTYVINKQTPNKQIWLSSPISGPKRYDYEDGIWIYKHDGSILHELLTKEVSDAIGHDVDFSVCSYGSR